MSDIGTASTPLMIVLLPLLPVVVGGLIGIIAGLVGPYFIQRAKDAADKKRKRAEKFEELVGAIRALSLDRRYEILHDLWSRK